MFAPLLYLCVAYLVGSIPTGYLLVKVVSGTDIRTQGSGNIGATNVKRVLGGKLSTLTLLLDVAKAYGVVWGAHVFQFPFAWVCAAAFSVLLGNCFSLFLKGQGGKGVATSFGIYAAFSPLIAFLGAVTYGGILGVSRVSAAGSLGAHLLFPLLCYVWQPPEVFGLSCAVSLLVVIRHRANIQKWF